MFEKLSDFHFKRFRDKIYETSGINFTETNRPILESRLKDRLRQSGLDSLDKYYQQIISSESELKTLLDAVTTNLTSFFRNKGHFEGFENGVIPDIMKQKKIKKIKLWSAGCSTGEEPYSLAMVLKEKLDPGWQIEIIASDISFNVLMKASEGYYRKERVTGVPPYYVQKYMIDTGDGYQIKDEIKKLVRFDYHNLRNDSGLRGFDIVFCRNVIIYFDAKMQQDVINRIYESMNTPGYFFIGHSESLFGMNTEFIFTKFGNTCLYTKKNEG